MRNLYAELKQRGPTLAIGAILLGTFSVSGPATAQDGGGFLAGLKGFFEVPAVSSPGIGRFVATLNAEETVLSYTLDYINLQGDITQAHIHVGQPGVNGGIVLFLCTNLDPPEDVPTPPSCPGPNSGQVTGTLTAADVIEVSGQGIGAGELDEIIKAMRSGSAYINVHTDDFPPGEIRGNVISGP